MSEKIAIIGIGNKLMGDEGVGIHAIEFLRTQNVADKFDLYDGGTGGMTLFHILEEYEHAIIIDAANFHGKAGEVRKFDLNDIKLTSDSKQISLHGISLAGILELARSLGKKMPKIAIVAIQPEKIGPSLQLSNACKNSLPRIYHICQLTGFDRSV